MYSAMSSLFGPDKWDMSQFKTINKRELVDLEVWRQHFLGRSVGIFNKILCLNQWEIAGYRID